VRPEAQPQHEEDDAGDEHQRQQHRAEEVDEPDRRALPVVQRQPVRRHRGGAACSISPAGLVLSVSVGERSS